MTERSVLHDTFVIERTYPAAPSRVFAAFTTKEAKEAWGDTGDLSEPGPDGAGSEFEFRVGGHERFGFGYQGVSYRYDARYYEISTDQPPYPRPDVQRMPRQEPGTARRRSRREV